MLLGRQDYHNAPPFYYVNDYVVSHFYFVNDSVVSLCGLRRDGDARGGPGAADGVVVAAAVAAVWMKLSICSMIILDLFVYVLSFQIFFVLLPPTINTLGL
jgi:hypothetical protein